MSQILPALLRLEGLGLTRKGLELASHDTAAPRFDDLDEEIKKLRRQLPGSILSVYDRLARRYADPLSMVNDGVCQGCHRKAAKAVVAFNDHPRRISQCEHCGRILFAGQHAPDYAT
ncbi:MAG: hypothetical protein IH623_24705 [Verrucomicrobia bacterium]|nr:hypothetical protein [Verrucomicrobiota bacterium]